MQKVVRASMPRTGPGDHYAVDIADVPPATEVFLSDLRNREQSGS